MHAKRFMKLLRQVGLLTKRQRTQLLDTLRPAIGMDRVCTALDGDRIATAERFLRAAVGAFHT